MDTFIEGRNRFGGINRASFGVVNLRNARIDGQVEMSGATFSGDIDTSFLQVGKSLLMQSVKKNRATFKSVDLKGATVVGEIDMLVRLSMET